MMNLKNPLQKRNLKIPKNPKKTFLDHFTELRLRFSLSVAVLIIGSIIGYFLQNHILWFLLKPLHQPLFYTSPSGGFNFTLMISLFFGFVVFLPFFVFQLIRFIEPAFPEKMKVSLVALLLSSCLLMVLGMAFAYFVSLPAALNFLAKFGSSEVKSLISTSEYFSFVTRYLLGFGVLFQLPLIMIFINKIKPLKFSNLIQFQKWVILISFVVAAIITPTPDFINQTIMAVPIILLYQISAIAVWTINKKKNSYKSFAKLT